MSSRIYTHIQCIGYQVPTVAELKGPELEFLEKLPLLPSKKPALPSSAPRITSTSISVKNKEILYIYGLDKYYKEEKKKNILSQAELKAVSFMILYHIRLLLENPSSSFTELAPTSKTLVGAVPKLNLKNEPNFFKYQEDLEKFKTNNFTKLDGYEQYELMAMIFFVEEVILFFRRPKIKWTIPSKTPADKDVKAVSIEYEKYKFEHYLSGGEHLEKLKKNNDAFNRVRRFINVFSYAYSNIAQHKDNDEKTLKVFMAPEFYFRPEKPIKEKSYHAYDYKTYQAIKEVLRATIKSIKPDGWLVIPGTIMWYAPAGSTPGKRVDLKVDTYFNSCPYIYYEKGAKFPKGEMLSRVEEKVKASHIDGVPYFSGDFNPKIHKKASAPKVITAYAGIEKKRKHLFELGGLKIGIEICLEHHLGILKDVLVLGQTGSKPKENPYLDLQLLTAGGMTIKKENVVLRQNGVFFRNDGHFNTLHVECQIEENKRYQKIDPESKWKTISPTPSVINLNNKGRDYFLLKKPSAPPKKLIKSEIFDKQEIRIYPKHEILKRQ